MASAPSPYLGNGSERLKRVRGKQHQSDIGIEEVSAVPKEKSIAPPMLPVSFQVKEPEEGHRAPWQPPKLAEGPAAPPREHRIRKLDTLEDLAERFLGSKDRAEELFEANRHILKDRHILPLGAAIRIPSGGADSPGGSSESDLQPVRALSDR
jgi:nucleoid-associated protein YgaU